MSHRVIVLNGISSAGKTTLAQALQNLLPDTWLTFGVDTLISAMPLRLDGAPEGLLIHPGGAVTTGPAWRAMEDDWRLGIGAMARAGVRIILDEVLFRGGADQRSWNDAFGDIGVLWVGVRIDPALAAERELARGDRVIGLAEKQASIVHAGMAYDLEVDTGLLSPDECACRIAERVAR